jgi:hypothetical protein
MEICGSVCGPAIALPHPLSDRINKLRTVHGPGKGMFAPGVRSREGEPVVGGWLQIHQPEVLPPYFAARKKEPCV